MPRRFNRGVLPQRRSPRRLTEWGFAEFGPTNVGATPVLLASFTAATLEDIIPCTVVRVRGLFHVKSDQLVTPEQWLGAIAVLIVSESARAAGVGSINTPFTEGVADQFFVYEFYAGNQEGTAAGEPQAAGLNFPIESKAMRKIVDGDSIAIVAENSTNTAGVSITGGFRILFKLH